MMANAKKCDRCGTLYEEREANTFNYIAQHMARIYNAKTYDREVALLEETFDLCPDCSKSLLRWFKECE